jgi:23S rRNA (guanine745-N1)-methyltransferase
LSYHSTDRRAMTAGRLASIVQCPHCCTGMTIINSNRSLMCRNNHMFDLAKQGYIHLLRKPHKGHYDKQLFTARRQILTAGKLFGPLTDAIREIMFEYVRTQASEQACILDAGAGEGSQLEQITRGIAVTGVGMDIAKAGMAMAAGSYKNQCWIVGDLANAPLQSNQFDMILNLLSPSNYKEFARLLKPGGMLVKVAPGPLHLKELKELLREGAASTIRNSHSTHTPFSLLLDLVDVIPLRYSVSVASEQLQALFHMTPLTWHATGQAERLMKQAQLTVTVDLSILIGRPTRS